MGQALDEAGAPLGDTVLSIDVRASARRRLTCRTEDDGSFQFELPRFDPIDYAESIRMTEISHLAKGSPIHQIHVRGPLQLGPGEIDLGRLNLEPFAAAASGRVVDEEGNGVADARVQIGELMPRDESKPAHATRRFRGWLGAKSGPGGWFTVPNKKPDSAPPAGTLVAFATHGERMTPTPIPFAQGDIELELRLAPGSGIQVDTRLIEPGYISSVPLEFYNLDAGVTGRYFGVGEVETVRPLRPGRYLLLAKLDGYIDGPYVTIGEEIHLRSGEIHVDPRLNPVVIENYVRRSQFDVALPDGSAPKWIELGRDKEGRVSGQLMTRNEDGFSVATAVGAKEPKYFIHVPGTRRLYLDSLPNNETLHLDAGIAVTLKLVGTPGTDPYDERICRGHIHLVAEFHRLRHLDLHFGQQVSFNAQGEADFAAPCAGKFQIALFGVRSGKRSNHFAPWHEATFHVPEGGGTVEVMRAD